MDPFERAKEIGIFYGNYHPSVDNISRLVYDSDWQVRLFRCIGRLITYPETKGLVYFSGESSFQLLDFKRKIKELVIRTLLTKREFSY